MTTKITVSLPDDLVNDARTAVKAGRAESVSAFVADALRERLSQRTLSELLADWDAELGTPTDEDMEWARNVLGR